MNQDFLITGSGIAGVFGAAALAPFGSVALREAKDVFGTRASVRSAAHLDDSYGLPPAVAVDRASRAGHETGGGLTLRGPYPVGCPVGPAGQKKIFANDPMRMSFAALDARRVA